MVSSVKVVFGDQNTSLNAFVCFVNYNIHKKTFMNGENISEEAGCRPSKDLTTGRCQLSLRVPQPGGLSIVGVSTFIHGLKLNNARAKIKKKNKRRGSFNIILPSVTLYFITH